MTSEGYQAGLRAEPLFGVAWDELWEVPIDEIRSRFGVGAARIGDDPLQESPGPRAIAAVG